MATQYGARVLRAEAREQQPGRPQDCDHYVQHRPGPPRRDRRQRGRPCRDRAARKQECSRDDQRLGAHCPQVPVTADVDDRRLARPAAPRYREGQPQPRQQRGLDRGRGIGMLAVAGEPVPEYVDAATKAKEVNARPVDLRSPHSSAGKAAARHAETAASTAKHPAAMAGSTADETRRPCWRSTADTMPVAITTAKQPE